MSEELDSQLSAMFDDELSRAECELLARRLARDEGLKQRWGQYALIRAALQTDEGQAALNGRVASRVRAVLASEAALPDTGKDNLGPAAMGWASRWWQPVAAVGVAAGVAALAIVWIGREPEGSAALVAQSAPTSEAAAGPGTEPLLASARQAAASEPESYVVPTSVEPPAMVPAMDLANYVVAHSEFSTPLGRRNLLSAFIASESGTAASPDESEQRIEDADGNANTAE